MQGQGNRMEQEEYLASDCDNCGREFNYLNHKWDICIICKEDEQLSWSELAELTHETQVDKFGWCMCEDTEPHEYPYGDCPKTGENE
jgi:hypothetical protein